jgi:ankyrin repeat protein
MKGNLAMVQCLVAELGADVNQATSNNECTPLIVAALKGHLAVVRCLIRLGAMVGAVANYGQTALLMCALSSRYATMQYLLEEADANMDDIDNGGNTT